MKKGLEISSSLQSPDQDVLMTWRSGWPMDVELEVPQVPFFAQEDIPSPAKPARSTELFTLQQPSLPSYNSEEVGTCQGTCQTSSHQGDSNASENKASIASSRQGINFFLTGLNNLPYVQVT
jgi:hypothetical protein